MTHFKVSSWLIVLIISAHGILVTEGRVLKSIKKQQPSVYAHNLQDLPADGIPSASLPVAKKKATFPTQVAAHSQGYGSSKPESVTDFRPTTPGKSPGAGHSFTEHRFDTQSEAIGVTAQSTPTGPGHSPGGGHSKQDQVVKPNT